MTKSTDPLGIKALVTPLGNESRPAEVLSEGRENTELLIEEDRYAS